MRRGVVTGRPGRSGRHGGPLDRNSGLRPDNRGGGTLIKKRGTRGLRGRYSTLSQEGVSQYDSDFTLRPGPV